MTADSWFSLIWGLLAPPIWSATFTLLGHRAGVRVFRLRATPWATFLAWWRWAVTSAALSLAMRWYSLAAGYAISVAVAFALSWWRKNRRRVRAMLGAKSRALRDALARRMPPARNPLPVPT